MSEPHKPLTGTELVKTAAKRIEEAFAKARGRRMNENRLDPGWPMYELQECAAAIEAAVAETRAEERARGAAIALTMTKPPNPDEVIVAGERIAQAIEDKS